MARTGRALGAGGQRRAERACGWGRRPMRQGTHALARGFAGLDALATRGRQRAAEPLPALLSALPALGDRPSQAAPPYRPNRLSTRLTATAVRRQGIGHPGSPAAERPTVPPITAPLRARGSSPPQVAQSQPPLSPQRTCASPQCTRAIRPLKRRTTSDVSPRMLQPPAQGAPARVGARVAPSSRRSSTLGRQRPRCPPAASAAQRVRNGWCLGGSPTGPVTAWRLAARRGGRPSVCGCPPGPRGCSRAITARNIPGAAPHACSGWWHACRRIR